ncbi:MAG: hypothetical protein Q4G58_05840 [bacterium]|nr:hypothetical protein [bacterium]
MKMKFNKESMQNSQYKKITIGILAAVLVIIVAIVAVVSNRSSDKETGNNTEQGGTETAGQDTQATDDPNDTSLKKNAYEKVNTLVTEYLNASKDGNMEVIAHTVSNGEELTKEQVQKPYEFVEKIQNVDCYTISVPEQGGYIVYVYYELKFVNIDTVAPGLMQLYVSVTSDDTLVILLNDLDPAVEMARKEALARDDVKQLISTANANLSEAANKDVKLKELITKFNAQESAATKATQAPAAPQTAATPAAQATEAPAATPAAK